MVPSTATPRDPPSDAVVQVREPAVVRQLGDKGTVPAAGTSAEFSGLIRKELEIWAQVVRATGVKPS